MLEDSSVHHSKSDEEESDEDTLDGGEIDTHLAQPRVEEEIEDGDDDNDADRVHVLDEIVGCSIQFHTSSHLEDLIVSNTEQKKRKQKNIPCPNCYRSGCTRARKLGSTRIPSRP